MEKRMILAIGLSMAVILIFSWRNAERLKEAQRRRAAQRTATPQQSAGPIQDASPSLSPTPDRSSIVQESETGEEPVAGDHWSRLLGAAEQVEEVTRVIESDLWRIELTNHGGVPVSWRLLNYQTIFPDQRYLELRSRQSPPVVPPPQLLDAPVERPDRLRPYLEHLRAYMDYADYRMDEKELALYKKLEPYLGMAESAGPVERTILAEELVLGDSLYPASPLLCRWGPNLWDTNLAYESRVRELNDTVEVSYVAESQGLKVSKIFEFKYGQYTVQFRIRIENTGDSTLAWGDDGQFRVAWLGGLLRPSTQRQSLNSAHVATVDGDIENYPKMPRETSQYVQIAESALKAGNEPQRMGDLELIWQKVTPQNGVRWVGVDTKYFLGAIVPSSKADGACVGLSKIPGDKIEYFRPAVGLDFTIDDLTPGEVKEYEFDLYVGPKEGERLAAVDPTLEELVQNYFLSSIVSPIARLLLYLLQFFHKIVPNYGVGIILLTFLVRLLMYPLYHKQMVSMKKMQALQPKINELKERYKDKPQELQKKTMEFYREHKVNPMAGCLTMLPTLPIFIALWGTFNQAIELRGAPFVGWIQNLSEPDQAFFIPIAGHIIPINILPLLYCVLMLWSQSRQKVEMPNAAAMKVIPIVFVFFFWSIASGVILYFVVSMSVDTVQRILMDKFGHEEAPQKARAAPAISRARKPGSRSQSRRKR